MSDDLPDEIMVWRSNPNLPHIGTWATTRYPADAVAYERAEKAKADKREMAMQSLADLGQAQEAYEAQLAAEATITQLRAALATAEQAAAEATARAEKAEGERDDIHEQVRDMLADQACACGYDKPTDVCIGHLSFHRKTVARAEAAEAHAAALAAQVERMREGLADIAKQKRTDEMETEYDVECADFEGGYDACIDTARRTLAALAPAPAAVPEKGERT